MGLDVRKFQREMEVCFAPILAGEIAPIEIGMIPKIIAE